MFSFFPSLLVCAEASSIYLISFSTNNTLQITYSICVKAPLQRKCPYFMKEQSYTENFDNSYCLLHDLSSQISFERVDAFVLYDWSGVISQASSIALFITNCRILSCRVLEQIVTRIVTIYHFRKTSNIIPLQIL